MQDDSLNFYFTPPQYEIATSKAVYPAFVGGFGSGKSETMEWLAISDMALHPDVRVAVYAPSHRILVRNTVPRLMEKLRSIGAYPKFNKTDMIITAEHPQFGTIMLSGMDDPEKIIAVEVFRSYVDELDTIKKDKAEEIWNKIIGRCRQIVPGIYDHFCNPDPELPNPGCGARFTDRKYTSYAQCIPCPECKRRKIEPIVHRRASAYTTPEGYEFVYYRWEMRGSHSEDDNLRDENYHLVRARTKTNPYLDPNYVSNLLSSYPKHLARAYLEGEFVNMKTGTVYYSYDKVKHRSKETIRPKEPLHIGVDFNVHNTAATIYVLRNYDTEWHAVAELTKLRDTKKLIEELKKRYADHDVTIYPDCSGASGSNADASISAIALLKQAGFKVRAKKKNPDVKDRINATLVALEKGRMFVNDLACPTVADCLVKQPYKDNGKPDKDSGFDHQNDATTYPIAHCMPIRRPVASPGFEFEKGY